MELQFCPVYSCSERLEPKKVVCAVCWRRLPHEIRERVFWAAAAGGKSFEARRLEAIEWLNKANSQP